jgi:hypothetical protein
MIQASDRVKVSTPLLKQALLRDTRWTTLSETQQATILRWLETDAESDLSSNRTSSMTELARTQLLLGLAAELLAGGDDLTEWLPSALHRYHRGQIQPGEIEVALALIKINAQPGTESAPTPATELRVYIFAMIQTALIIKAIVLYFGLTGAEESSEWRSWAAVGTFSLSLISLSWLAVRQSRLRSPD